MILTKIPAKRKNDYYLVITDAYRENGKVKRRAVKSLGYLSDLKQIYDDPIAFFTEEAKRMTEYKKKFGGIKNIKIDFSEKMEFENCNLNAGSLIIKKFYDQLNLDYIFRKAKEKSKIKANLAGIFEFLVINQIVSPDSKLGSFNNKNNYLKQYNFSLDEIYRSLTYINSESYELQKQLLKNSQKIIDRNFNKLYYDCTNYYFEIELEDDFRKFGFSKEHRPNPLVQMGLFCDSNGIPVMYDLFEGSQNEQKSMIPIEEKMLKTLGSKRTVVCADAGLCSANNKYFNSIGNRDYIFVQSLKKVKAYLDDEIFTKNNKKWLEVNPNFKIFVRPINDKITIKDLFGLNFDEVQEANIIVTYDQEFADYLKTLRERRIEKAKEIIKNPKKFNKENSKDGRQYIKSITFDANGEIVSPQLILDESKIKDEEKYDGYYALITSMIDEEPIKIIEINKKRWQIEDCFRTLKTTLKARPVYLSTKERIQTHFLINFFSLTLLKIIQAKIRTEENKSETTIDKIVESLREFSFTKIDETTYKNNYFDETLKILSEKLNLPLNNKFYNSSNITKIFD